MKRYKRKFEESFYYSQGYFYPGPLKEADDNEAKTLEAVKELIDMKDISTEDEQGKFIELLKGIVFADNKHGDEFLKQINDFTSSLKIEDFKEGCKKKPKKKDLKEMFHITNEVSAQQAITDGFTFLANRYGMNHPKLFQKIGFALSVAASEVLDNSELDDIQKSKIKLKTFVKIFQNIKERI